VAHRVDLALDRARAQIVERSRRAPLRAAAIGAQRPQQRADVALTERHRARAAAASARRPS
jgi:hypothetical protein